MQVERAQTLVELADVCTFFYRDPPGYDDKAAAKSFRAAAVEPLCAVRDRLAAVTDWSRETIHAALHATVAELGTGFGKLGMPLRLAVTGGSPSPELDLTLQLVGRDASLRRIERALDWIRARHSGVETA